MKKIFVGSIVLLFFSLAMILFQFSCSKNGFAGTENTVQQNKILYYTQSTAVNGYGEVWTANYDGSNAKKVALTLPAGLTLSTDGGPRLSPDCKTIFLVLRETISQSDIRFHIYSCNIDGSNLQRVITGQNVMNGSNLLLGAAF
jgi:Tol biopolymer transport system component